MKPTPARQRREARMAAYSFQRLRVKAYNERRRLPTISISKRLRKHRLKLMSALLRA